MTVIFPEALADTGTTTALEQLGDEIEASLGAVASAALESLEESLWKQQVLCAQLQLLLRTHPLQEGDAHRMRALAAQLLAPQQQFAAVIQQAHASATVLLRLCAAHQPAFETNRSLSNTP